MLGAPASIRPRRDGLEKSDLFRGRLAPMLTTALVTTSSGDLIMPSAGFPLGPTVGKDRN